MLIKIGRKEFDVNNKDTIFYNGACYMLTSQLVGFSFNNYPIVSKTQMAKLLKENKVILVSESLAYKNSDGYECWYKHYKFNVE